MKKLLTGAFCAAAIGAAAVVLLPVAAVTIAVRLSKPRERSTTGGVRDQAVPASSGFLPGQDREDESLVLESHVKS